MCECVQRVNKEIFDCQAQVVGFEVQRARLSSQTLNQERSAPKHDLALVCSQPPEYITLPCECLQRRIL